MYRTERALYRLAKDLKEYESDTFSAEASGITEEEAEEVAEILALEAIEEMLDRLDGDKVREALRMYREELS